MFRPRRQADIGIQGDPDPVPDTCAGLLSVAVYHQDQAEVLVVVGELDMDTAPQLSSEIARCLDGRPTLLVLDLTEVSFMGSSGMAALVAAQQTVGPDSVLRVVTDQRAVLRPLQIAQLDRILALYSSVDEAVTAP
jgi:anti-sigma B factor antagonist